MTTRAALRAEAQERQRTRTTRSIRRATAIALLVLISVAAGGAAVAYFRSVGAGSGSSTSGSSATAFTLAPATTAGDLYPGGSGTVTATLTNTGDATLRLPSVQIDASRGTGGFTLDAAHSTCPASSFSFAPQNNGGSGWTLAAGRSRSISLVGSLSTSASAPNSCQGATVTVHLKAGS